MNSRGADEDVPASYCSNLWNILDILLNILKRQYIGTHYLRGLRGEGVGTGYGLGVSVDKYVGAPNIFFEINAAVTKEYR